MAALSPVIVKTSFYLPSKTNQAKNVANLLYISDKPETAREYDELDLEPERNMENINDAEKHLEYAASREGSHGVFDADNRTADLISIKDELKNSDSIVYRLIISLREDEAIRINHSDRVSFEETICKSMPAISEKIGITESNLRWAAAFHEKEGHPHAHILMWESNSERTVGRLSNDEMKEIRKVFTRNIYQKVREKLYIEKTYLRDVLRESGKEAMLQARQDLKAEEIFTQKDIGKREKIGPNIEPEQERVISKKLEHLADIMPSGGRIALKYMPDEVKDEARNVADWILTQPGYQQSVKRYCDIQKELASHYQKNPEKIKQVEEKAYQDIRDRVSQDVLKVAGKIKTIEIRPDRLLLANARAALKAVWNSIEKERSKAEAKALIVQRQLDNKRRKEKSKEKEEDRQR